MPKYGKRSLTVLSQLHPDLKTLMKAVIKYVDISLICGNRGKVAQNAAYYAKPQRSKLKWPLSKHNKRPSEAVDWVPYPDGKVIDYIYIAGAIKMCAAILFTQGKMKYGIRIGCDWDKDARVSDEKFMDAGHVELVIV